MDRSLCWIALLWAIFIEGSEAACSYPGTISGTGVIAETVKTSYDVDDIVLYKCDKLGAGHVFRRCLENDSWTDLSRSCETLELFDSGALAGILVALLNYTAAVVIIVYVKKKFPDGEDGKGDKMDDNKMNSDSKQQPVTTVVVLDNQLNTSRDIKLEDAESTDYLDSQRNHVTPTDV